MSVLSAFGTGRILYFCKPSAGGERGFTQALGRSSPLFLACELNAKIANPLFYSVAHRVTLNECDFTFRTVLMPLSNSSLQPIPMYACVL